MSKLLSVATILLIAFCSNAYGQIWYPRTCRTVTAMPNFQPQRFVGTWFEHSRYESTPAGADCNQFVLAAVPNINNQFVVNTTTRLTNNTEVNRGGFAQFFPTYPPPTIPYPPNTFNIVFNATEPRIDRSFQVIITNYDSIAILFYCREATNSTPTVPASEEFAWIVTREPQPSTEINLAILQLSSIFLEPHHLRSTNQDPARCDAVQLYGSLLFALILSIMQLVK